MSDERKKHLSKPQIGIMFGTTIVICFMLGAVVCLILSVADICNLTEFALSLFFAATSTLIAVFALWQSIKSSKVNTELQKKIIELQKEMIELQKSKQDSNDNK